MEAIKIIDYKTFKGRNIYSHTPIFQLVADIGQYYNVPTNAIKDFNEKLLEAFPGLRKHTCSLGYEGGFLERLKSGTYLAHILEHVILDMQNELGFAVKYGKTISCDTKSRCTLFFEYENEECALECCRAAVSVLNCFLNGNSTDINYALKDIRSIKEQTQVGPSTAALIAEAKKRMIPVQLIGSGSLLRLSYGSKSRFLQATLSDSTSCIATDICSDKHLTKQILSSFSVPVPEGMIVNSPRDAVDAARSIGLPVVVKPMDANQGKGVRVNLRSERDIRDAYRFASLYGNKVVVERYIKGNDYRILVVGGTVSAVSKRMPPCVIGDGTHTIEELVKTANADVRRGSGHGKPLTRIELDESCLAFLRQHKFCPDYVPAKGKAIKLRENSNLSTGGTAMDCTDILHPDNAEIAIRCAKALGIDIAGIDMVTKDISQSIVTNGGAVIEVNVSPGIRMHLYPETGKPRNVAKDIMHFLYPEDKDWDFPIISVTGTNGKTTTVRLAAHILGLTGKTVGMTCTTGTYINGKCIKKGDNAGYLSAQELLLDKSVEAAVLETARGGIIKKGLGYDLANVGVITNVSEDHLGLDGIDSISDMSYVKSLVAEAVKPGGYAVLNAEDESTNSILKNVTAQIIFFYSDIKNVKTDLKNCRKLVYAEDGMIKIYDDGKKIDIEEINSIPLTLYGLSDCNIQNCLAATAAVYSLGVSPQVIAQGLKSFKLNSGRFELYDMDRYKIMLDYGHNIAAYQEVIKLCNKIEHKRLVGIIGVPGDRTDASIKKIGQLAAQSFPKIYIKEDKNLRNRTKNEIADILYQAITTADNGNEITNAEDEVAALQDAITSAKNGDLIVILYENLTPLAELINKYKNQYKNKNMPQNNNTLLQTAAKLCTRQDSSDMLQIPENAEMLPGQAYNNSFYN